MSDLISNRYSLDRGIEGVSHHGINTDDQDLLRGSLSPPEQRVTTLVSQELKGSTDTAGYLKSALEPKISNPEVLLPSRFESVLSRVRDDLIKRAEKQPELVRIINRVTPLLTEEMVLREMAKTLRNTLQQG